MGLTCHQPPHCSVVCASLMPPVPLLHNRTKGGGTFDWAKAVWAKEKRTSLTFIQLHLPCDFITFLTVQWVENCSLKDFLPPRLPKLKKIIPVHQIRVAKEHFPLYKCKQFKILVLERRGAF